MEDEKLTDLESRMYDAYETYIDCDNTLAAAQKKAEETEAAYRDAAVKYSDRYDYTNMEAKEQNFRETLAAMKEAQAELETAQKNFDEAAEAAQAAEDKVNEKKEELRSSRDADTDYVVHTARIECSCAVRDSYLALAATHGVYTRLIPQMTVKDTLAFTNLISFGNCTCMENPSVQEAAQAAVDAAQQEIEANKGMGDKIVDFFVKPEKPTASMESMAGQVLGECLMEFPAGAVWLKGRDGVTINDEAPLLRRCELTCKYGGQITILLSGQPE